MNRKRLSVAAVAAAALAALVAALLGTGSANAASSATVLRLTSGGTTSLNVTGSTSRVDGTSQETTDAEVDEDVPGSGNSASRVPSSGVPAPAANAVTATGSELVKGFAGLNHADQRFSGTGQYAGTNFSLEPPDQALCVGGGYVVESVNDAIRAYTTSGAAVTSAVALNQFFKLSPGIVRGATPVYGDFTSDPKCLYDNGHFYVTILQAGTVKSTGDFDGTGHVEIAVSRTSDPTGAWSLYSIDNANDSGDCPCLGDQPLIGADANGFYVTTNSFPFFDDGFNGAQVYAISKSQLEAGASSVNVVKVPVVAPAGFDGTPYTLQPAKAAPGTANAFNTEYFLSALDFNATLDNRIAVWSLTGTSTLNSASPNLTLTGKVLDSQVYGQPPAAQQSSDGVFPLRDGLLGLSVQQALYGVQWDNGTYHTELLNSNDDRMNEVIYAGGKLYGALNTVVKTPNGPTHSGIAWWAVDPVRQTIANQGYLTANQENLMFPAFGVNSAGKGAIGVTIVGTDVHPSTAYALFNGNSFGPLHLAFAGPVANDGFTGYEALLPNADRARKAGTQKGVARWGDYAATAVDTDGTIWLANETTATTRSLLANWGTYISHVRP